MDIPAQCPEMSSASTVRPNAKSHLALFGLEVKVFECLIKVEEEGVKNGEGNW